MSPQTTYPDGPEASRAGQLVDNGQKDVVTRFAAADIPVGRFVTRDGTTYQEKVKLPAASADVTDIAKLQGVVIRDLSQPNRTGSTPDALEATRPLPVLKKGRVYVYCEQTVAVTDPVYVRYTANGAGKDPGQVRMDADTAKAALLASGRFLAPTEAGDFAPVEFDLP